MNIYMECKICGKHIIAKRSDRRFCEECQKERESISKRKYGKSILGELNYKRYRSTEHYRRKSRERYYRIDENVRRARYTVSNAVRDNRLKKKTACENCGSADKGKERSYLEAHHYLGYEKENWLKVQWLCVPCHKLTQEVFMR